MNREQANEYDKLAQAVGIDYAAIAEAALEETGVSLDAPHRYSLESHRAVAKAAARKIVAMGVNYTIEKATEGLLDSSAPVEVVAEAPLPAVTERNAH